MAASFISGGSKSTQKKIYDLSQVTDKYYHIMWYQALIVIDSIGRCISNYHMIKTKRAPCLNDSSLYYFQTFSLD